MKINIIDNLFSTSHIPKNIELLVYKTILNSFRWANTEHEYSNDIIEKMSNNRSPEKILSQLKKSYFVYISNEMNQILAFASISKEEGKYYLSWLQVLPEHLGNGYARILSDHREEVLKKHSVDIAYIESLTFINSIQYHIHRGFKFDGDQTGLSHSIRMFKYLK